MAAESQGMADKKLAAAADSNGLFEAKRQQRTHLTRQRETGKRKTSQTMTRFNSPGPTAAPR